MHAPQWRVVPENTTKPAKGASMLCAAAQPEVCTADGSQVRLSRPALAPTERPALHSSQLQLQASSSVEYPELPARGAGMRQEQRHQQQVQRQASDLSTASAAAAMAVAAAAAAHAAAAAATNAAEAATKEVRARGSGLGLRASSSFSASASRVGSGALLVPPDELAGVKGQHGSPTGAAAYAQAVPVPGMAGMPASPGGGGGASARRRNGSVAYEISTLTSDTR